MNIKIPKIERKYVFIAIGILLVVGVLALYWYNEESNNSENIVSSIGNVIENTRTQNNCKLSSNEYIASVNCKGILRSDFEDKLEKKLAFYEWANQADINRDLVRKDVIDQMISDELVADFAKDHGISVSKEEIETRYQNSFGALDEEEYLHKLSDMYGMDKDDYFDVLELEILREKVNSFSDLGIVDLVKSIRENSEIEIFD